jgi:hypothetical protein
MSLLALSTNRFMGKTPSLIGSARGVVWQKSRASVGTSLLLTSRLPRLHMPVRSLSQEKQVKETGCPLSPKIPLSPLVFCQKYARENLSVNQQALMIKTMLIKGLTLQELYRFFSTELNHPQVISLLLKDAESRTLLCKLASAKFDHPISSKIAEVVVDSDSEILAYQVALEMTKGILNKNGKISALTGKTYGSLDAKPEKLDASISGYDELVKEALKWISIGCRTKKGEAFAKEIYALFGNEKQPVIKEIQGRLFPKFPDYSWQERFLVLYEEYYSAPLDELVNVAWHLHFELPLDLPLKDKLQRIPAVVWNYFFHTFPEKQQVHSACLEMEQFFSSAYPHRCLHELNAIIKSLKPKTRNENNVYNGGC